jgi:ATP-binding cassette, subfamily C, bacterial CydC
VTTTVSGPVVTPAVQPGSTPIRHPLLTVLRLIRSGRRDLIMALFGALLEHGGAIIGAAAVGWVVGAAASGRAAGDLTGPIVVVAVALLASVLGNWMLGQFGHAFAFRSQAQLRLQLFDALDRSAPREVQGRRTGDLAAVVMGDVDVLEGFFAHLGIGAAVAMVTGAGSVAVLGFIHPLLALVAAVGMLAAGLLAGWLARREQERARELRSELGMVNADVVDGVQGLRELLVFDHIDPWYRRIARRTAGLRHRQLDHAKVTGLQTAATDGLVAATTVGVLVAVVGAHAAGTIPLTSATMAITLVIAAFAPVTAAIGMAGPLAPLRASARRVLDVLAQPAQVPDTATSAPDIGSAEVRFEAVTFSYPGGVPVLHDINLDVPAHEMVALVGHSGAGKSTCVNLLLRFWDPDSGRITVGDHDLREFPLAQLHRVVTVVPQDVYLFAGSVADNLRLGRPDASQADLERAARAANAHDFVAALPDGYDTAIGERGALLSGGQRQRLAVARALLADTPVLVLDEASSNLDSENERLLQQAIRAARQGRTTIVIAHRLSTIRAADRVVVLDHGQIVETGTHDALLARGGRYADLMADQLSPAG